MTKEITEILTDKFNEALIYAARIHARQYRKGTEIPYISHPLAVAGLVLEYGGREKEAIAALLHDAVEDQGGLKTYEEIKVLFGAEVAEIVEGCTDAWETPKPDWKTRKEKYIAHIPAASPSVRLVSAADKLHNARAILADYRIHGEKLWDRFTGGKAGTLWYYNALVETFKVCGPVFLIRELAGVVDELTRLAEGR